jgi:hypothetical protein
MTQVKASGIVQVPLLSFNRSGNGGAILPAIL